MHNLDLPAVAVAQSASVDGHLEANVLHHQLFVRLAHSAGARLVLFPELSLTGYLPADAPALAITPDDPRLEPLREQARALDIVVIAGAPLRTADVSVHLAALAMLPDGSLSVYAKRNLHEGEQPYFTAGTRPMYVHVERARVATIVCMDISRPDLAAEAAAGGATFLAAGVLNTPTGLEKDLRLLERYAVEHGLTVLMANHAATTGGWTSGGGSTILSPEGAPIVRVEGTGEAVGIAVREDGVWKGRVVQPAAAP